MADEWDEQEHARSDQWLRWNRAACSPTLQGATTTTTNNRRGFLITPPQRFGFYSAAAIFCIDTCPPQIKATKSTMAARGVAYAARRPEGCVMGIPVEILSNAGIHDYFLVLGPSVICRDGGADIDWTLRQ